jgi:hypothetical protein
MKKVYIIGASIWCCFSIQIISFAQQSDTVRATPVNRHVIKLSDTDNTEFNKSNKGDDKAISGARITIPVMEPVSDSVITNQQGDIVPVKRVYLQKKEEE